MKHRSPPLQSTRLLDQVRERVRYLHYSLSTEKTYLYWVRFFVRWSGRGGTMRHPRDMGATEVQAFLSMLATERHVSAATHNQALMLKVAAGGTASPLDALTTESRIQSL